MPITLQEKKACKQNIDPRQQNKTKQKWNGTLNSQKSNMLIGKWCYANLSPRPRNIEMSFHFYFWIIFPSSKDKRWHYGKVNNNKRNKKLLHTWPLVFPICIELHILPFTSWNSKILKHKKIPQIYKLGVQLEPHCENSHVKAAPKPNLTEGLTSETRSKAHEDHEYMIERIVYDYKRCIVKTARNSWQVWWKTTLHSFIMPSLASSMKNIMLKSY